MKIDKNEYEDMIDRMEYLENMVDKMYTQLLQFRMEYAQDKIDEQLDKIKDNE